MPNNFIHQSQKPEHEKKIRQQERKRQPSQQVIGIHHLPFHSVPADKGVAILFLVLLFSDPLLATTDARKERRKEIANNKTLQSYPLQAPWRVPHLSKLKTFAYDENNLHSDHPQNNVESIDTSVVENTELAIKTAVFSNDVKFLRSSLVNGLDPNQIFKDQNGNIKSLLQFCIAQKRPELVKILLRFKADPNYKSGEHGITALHIAIKHCIECINPLVRAGADINAVYHMEGTPLRLAVGHNWQALPVLIASGANFEAEKNQLAYYALLNPDPSGLEYLFSQRVEINRVKLIATWKNYQQNGEVIAFDKLIELINKYESVSLQQDAGIDDGYVPIADFSELKKLIKQAVLEDNAEFIKQVIEARPDLAYIQMEDIKFDERHTIIFLGVKYSARKIVTLFIEKGFDINEKDAYGLTLLHWAILRSPQMIPVLMQLGADINAKTTDFDLTPLHLGALSKTKEVIPILMQFNPDIDIRNTKEETPILTAARDEPSNVIVLLKNGVTNVNSQSKSEKLGALHFLIQQGCEAEVRALLKAGANPNIKNRREQTPLHYAIRYMPKLISLLMAHGADVNAKDDQGLAPVAWAVTENKYAILAILLNYNAIYNRKELLRIQEFRSYGSSDNKEELLRILNNHEYAKKNFFRTTYQLIFQLLRSPYFWTLMVVATFFETVRRVYLQRKSNKMKSAKVSKTQTLRLALLNLITKDIFAEAWIYNANRFSLNLMFLSSNIIDPSKVVDEILGELKPFLVKYCAAKIELRDNKLIVEYTAKDHQIIVEQYDPEPKIIDQDESGAVLRLKALARPVIDKLSFIVNDSSVEKKQKDWLKDIELLSEQFSEYHKNLQKFKSYYDEQGITIRNTLEMIADNKYAESQNKVIHKHAQHFIASCAYVDADYRHVYHLCNLPMAAHLKEAESAIRIHILNIQTVVNDPNTNPKKLQEIVESIKQEINKFKELLESCNKALKLLQAKLATHLVTLNETVDGINKANKTRPNKSKNRTSEVLPSNTSGANTIATVATELKSTLISAVQPTTRVTIEAKEPEIELRPQNRSILPAAAPKEISVEEVKKIQAAKQELRFAETLITPSKTLKIVTPSIVFEKPKKFKKPEKHKGDFQLHLSCAHQAAVNIESLLISLTKREYSDSQNIIIHGLLYYMIRLSKSFWNIANIPKYIDSTTTRDEVNSRKHMAQIRHLLVHPACLEMNNDTKQNAIYLTAVMLNEQLTQTIISLNKNFLAEETSEADSRALLLARVEAAQIDKMPLLLLAQQTSLPRLNKCCNEINKAIAGLKNVTKSINSVIEFRNSLMHCAAVKMYVVKIGEYWQIIQDEYPQAAKDLNAKLNKIDWSENHPMLSFVEICVFLRGQICHVTNLSAEDGMLAGTKDISDKVLDKLRRNLPEGALFSPVKSLNVRAAVFVPKGLPLNVPAVVKNANTLFYTSDNYELVQPSTVDTKLDTKRERKNNVML